MVTDNEQRKYIRVPFKAVACLWSLKQDAEEIRCDQTRDISLKGIYCYSDIKFSVGTPIKFEEMDLDSFLFLKNILSYNTGDPEKIEKELTGYIHKE
ncbi:MAG: PilZ domain-containing protein [Deltaproteobacteria bacterium]|nr:PilZ domain-containing protein [Deltaproteobacteria bacterium]